MDTEIGAKNFEILLVNDGPHLVEMIGSTMVDKGHQVTTVHNGSSALELLRERRFDLVFSDLAMIASDRNALLRMAKEHKPEAMVILLGGRDNMDVGHDILSFGAYEYISTPCGMPAFWKQVTDCIDKLEFKRRSDHAS